MDMRHTVYSPHTGRKLKNGMDRENGPVEPRRQCSRTMLTKQEGIIAPIRILEVDKKGSTRPRRKGGLPKW